MGVQLRRASLSLPASFPAVSRPTAASALGFAFRPQPPGRPRAAANASLRPGALTSSCVGVSPDGAAGFGSAGADLSRGGRVSLSVPPLPGSGEASRLPRSFLVCCARTAIYSPEESSSPFPLAVINPILEISKLYKGI